MPRESRVALTSIPASVATCAGIAFRLTFHDPGLAVGMATLVGTLALISVLLGSSEAQRTVRVWIRHRAEHRLAAADAFEVRRRIRTATCGRRWTEASAAKIRQDAAACERPSISLPEIMRITRLDGFAVAPLEPGDPEHVLPVASGDDVGL